MLYTPCMMQLACARDSARSSTTSHRSRSSFASSHASRSCQEKDSAFRTLKPKRISQLPHDSCAARTDSELDPDATRRAAAKAAIEAQEISLSQLIDQLNTSGTFDAVEFKRGPKRRLADNRFEFGRRMCVEVQLRTIAMDSWASIQHDLKYKKDAPNQEFLQAELKRCADDDGGDLICRCKPLPT